MSKLILLLALTIPVSILAQVKIGKKAPELDLEEVYYQDNKKPPTLESLSGNIVILDFWAIWCSPCVAAIPENNELSKKYKDKGVQFIAITDDPKEKLENFLNKVNIEFWVGRDDDKQDFENYKVQGRPQMYIINRDGNIVYQGHGVNEEMIEEVLATNSVTLPKKNIIQKVITDGGFAPGEDPLYNGVNIMLGAKSKHRNRLISHFIIRPSFDSWGQYGYRTTEDGHVGITYSGGKLENIFRLLHDLSSPIWIRNNTNDTTNYDIIYWKKASSLEVAFNEVEQNLLEGLSIKFDSIKSEQKVNLLFLNKKTEFIKKQDEIEEGTYKAYTSINTFVSELENKSQQYYMVDDSIKDMFVENKGMGWKKMKNATSDEILEFLKEKGVILKQEKTMVTVYEINAN